MKKVYLYLTSELLMRHGPSAFQKRFNIVDDIDDAEIVVVDGVVGLQKALAESECEIWVNLVDVGKTLADFGGFEALVVLKNKNPRVKIYDAFGREGCDGDYLDFMGLVETFSQG